MTEINQIEWKTKMYEAKLNVLEKIPTVIHPLKLNLVTERIPSRRLSSQPSTGCTSPTSTPSFILEPLSVALEGVDPLTAFAIEEVDPLARLSQETEKGTKESLSTFQNGSESWKAKKSSILAKFTTNERLSIVTSFLQGGEKVIVKAQNTAVDKVQHRLEQLDVIDEASQNRFELTQVEYISRIEQLNRELVNAWNSEQRVKSLKIVIQCAKLLSDTSVISFYPSKFVLITDILDVFGQLVYNRLRNKNDAHNRSKMRLPDNFTPEMVSESTKETCLNWFYKIASIRELVPRLYVEMALINCYTFTSKTACNEVLERIVKMIHGIGNPLVAIYARCYLCRIGRNLNSNLTNNFYLVLNIDHFLQSYSHVFGRAVKTDLRQQKTTIPTYATLFTPALDFMLESLISVNPNQATLLNDFIERAKIGLNTSLILNSIMSTFRPIFISEKADELLDLMEKCTDQGVSMDEMLRTLGLCVSLSPPDGYETRKCLLKRVWSHVTVFDDSERYISCAEPWIVFIVKNFSQREINAVLGDLIDHIGFERNLELFYNRLKYIVKIIIYNMQDFESLLVMDNFLPLVDLFQQESIKVEICKNILTSSKSSSAINDPVVVNALMYLCTILHDSVNALTADDEYRQIGDILCQVISKIDYGRDFEQQLTFYVEARAAFCNIDIVFVHLVQCVNSLSVHTTQITKGHHTRKTSDFVRACAAYAFITIPDIKSVKHRLKLYLFSGQVALFNQCLGQAEGIFKAALSTISNLQPGEYSELELVAYIKQFLSLLLVIPDNPDCGVLSFLRLLLNVVQNFAWKTNASIIAIYLSVLDLLSVMAQEEYPYNIDRIESNDALYGSDLKFILEVDKIAVIILGEMQTKLTNLDLGRRQADLAIELLVKMAIRNKVQNSDFISWVWRLCGQNSCDQNYLIRSRAYLESISLINPNLREKLAYLT